MVTTDETMYHVASQPPTEDLQLCTTEVDNGLCSLLNAHR